MTTMAARLSRFYCAYADESTDTISQIWSGVSALSAPLISALVSREEDRITKVISTLGVNGQLHGLESEKIYALDSSGCIDSFHKLAQLSGVIPYFSPNQPSHSFNWQLSDIESAKVGIEKEMGCQLSVPHFFGLDCNGKVPLRLVLYQAPAAISIRRLLKAKTPRHTLEIGGGVGLFAMIVNRWGGEQYTVIDLPHVATMSAWFMSGLIGEDKIWLSGEPENKSAFARYYPSCRTPSGFKADLVYNCDSFPEIPTHQQDRYISLIKDCLTDDGMFFSINHESDQAGQSSVLLATKRTEGLALRSRHPYAMLPGYVEEVFTKI